MSFLVKEKSFYKNMLSIAVPIALQNLINFGVSVADTVMLGKLGETALSASSLANQPGFVFMLTVFGMGNGAMVLCSQYWGKQEMEPIRKIFGMIIKFAVALGVILMVVVFSFPEAVMRIFTPEQAVIAEGVKYLRVIAFTYIFTGFANVMVITMRSIEIIRISIITSTSSLLLNVTLNYILIFGNFGAPALGVTGAAIATLIARISECVIVIVYLAVFDKRLKLKWKHILSIDKPLLSDYLRYAAPVVIGETLWSLGMATQSMILGRLGEDAVSANAICSVVQQLTQVFVFGISNACGVVIGKTVGVGDFKRAHNYAKTMQVMFLGLGLVCAVTMLSLRDAVISIYNLSAGTQMLARQFLTVNSFVVFTIAFTTPSMVGILRGGGDARYVLLLDLIFVWGVTIPFGAVAGLVFHLPMPLVYMCLKLDEPIKAVLSFIRIRGTKWMRNVTRSEIPLEE